MAAAIKTRWAHYLGGQFWVGGWWWGNAIVTFFRDVCKLDLPGDLWDRAQAYEDINSSACWSWPHKNFVIAVERPKAIHRELVDPTVTRGLGSHRLHNASGPAVEWNGWSVWAIHGVRVTEQIVMRPETLTAAQIDGEGNQEVRRVMIERFGAARWLRESGAMLVHEDKRGKLWRKTREGDTDVVMVEVKNSTPEPDGSIKDYWLRVPPTVTTVTQAVAWTFCMEPTQYAPRVET
jgi:hypothetical protein